MLHVKINGPALEGPKMESLVKESVETWLSKRNKGLKVAFKLRYWKENVPSCAHVLHQTLNLVTLYWCYVENAKEMQQEVKCMWSSFSSYKTFLFSEILLAFASSLLKDLVLFHFKHIHTRAILNETRRMMKERYNYEVWHWHLFDTRLY